MNKALTIHEIYALACPGHTGGGHAVVSFSAGSKTRWLVHFSISANNVVTFRGHYKSLLGRATKFTYRHDVHQFETPILEAIQAHWVKLAPSLDFDKATRDKLTMDVRSAESAVEAATKALGEAHIKLDKAKAALAAVTPQY
jgi:hypothetical protein